MVNHGITSTSMKIMKDWWRYENLPSGHPYDWSPADKEDHPDDQIDFHIDLGAGNIPKGRLTIDRHGKVDMLMDLDDKAMFFPFPENSIESIISHHCLEHIGDGFLNLMDECYRILKPGGKFRIIVPLFPSFSAVTDPDHKRYFTTETLLSFEHNAGPEVPFWTDTFAEPYTKCRFSKLEQQYTEPDKFFADKIKLDIDKLFHKHRELRATLTK